MVYEGLGSLKAVVDSSAGRIRRPGSTQHEPSLQEWPDQHPAGLRTTDNKLQLYDDPKTTAEAEQAFRRDLPALVPGRQFAIKEAGSTYAVLSYVGFNNDEPGAPDRTVIHYAVVVRTVAVPEKTFLLPLSFFKENPDSVIFSDSKK